MHDFSCSHLSMIKLNHIIVLSDVNVWNSLPHTFDFTSLASFKRTIAYIDFSDFLKVFRF